MGISRVGDILVRIKKYGKLVITEKELETLGQSVSIQVAEYSLKKDIFYDLYNAEISIMDSYYGSGKSAFIDIVSLVNSADAYTKKQRNSKINPDAALTTDNLFDPFNQSGKKPKRSWERKNY